MEILYSLVKLEIMQMTFATLQLRRT